MLEKVELHDPSQLEIASVISGRFNQQNKELGVSGVLPTLDDNSLSVDFDSSSVAGKSNKIYPRTPSEQADYDRQGLDYDAAKKLLDFGGLKILENPRYLPKRFVSTFFTQCVEIEYFSTTHTSCKIDSFQTIYGSASTPLEDNENNYHGWDSVMLDPDEEGASKLVKMIGKSKFL